MSSTFVTVVLQNIYIIAIVSDYFITCKRNKSVLVDSEFIMKR